MHPKLFQAKAFLNHLRHSKTRWGHGVHSPFVFNLIEQVFNSSGHYYCFDDIEAIRSKLLIDHQTINVDDLGAGSQSKAGHQRKISQIAKSALLPTEHAQLVFKLCNYFKADTIVELGTSLGITTAYMASARRKAQVFTIEGSAEILKVAENNFKLLELDNIVMLNGNFNQRLPELLNGLNQIDIAFIDGNHQLEPTLNYFDLLLTKVHNDSLLIFDDIYWSEGMQKAWKRIIAHPKVTVSIDIYRMGLVFFRQESSREDFIVRF
ncbi:MAG: class I SAM-dependent methyltransferase [Bacteroidales bacterium]|nr:class I SAM-dependent methyltransferase [Bacteroidales bacterium]